MRKLTLAKSLGLIFPAIGPGQYPAIADNGSMPDQISLINGMVGLSPFQECAYHVDTSTAAETMTGSEISGGSITAVSFTGTFAGAAAITLPTTANLFAAMPASIVANPVGNSWLLRILNQTGGGFTLTVTTNTGWTVNGTMTIATATWRDFIVTLSGTVAAPTAVIQDVGGSAIV